MTISRNTFANRQKASLLKACSEEIFENAEFRKYFKKEMRGKAYLPSLSYIGGTFFKYVSSLPEVSGILIEDAVDAFVDLKANPSVETLKNLERSYSLPQVETWFGMLEALEKKPQEYKRFVRDFSIFFENVVQGSIEKYPESLKKSMEEFKNNGGKFRTHAFRHFDETVGWKLLQSPPILNANFLKNQIQKPSASPISSATAIPMHRKKPRGPIL